MTDKPRNTNMPVSDMRETRRWSPTLQRWLYPTFNAAGKLIWVTIPE